MRGWTVFATAALMALPVIAAAQAPAASSEPDGAALYRQHCKSCHGARGVPSAQMHTIYPTLKALADSTEQAHLTEQSIVGVLQKGKGKDMKPFTGKLSAAEMAAVAKFVKALASPAASKSP
jgi:mono/diheme cytochrome c family protein